MPRKTKQLAVRDEFLILTNGKRTEKNYFEAVRSNYKSIFKISVKFMNDDPVALVDHAIGMKNARNRVWCVFDKDEFPTDSVEPAIKTAKDNGIGIAFSNIAFEVWLIDHFEKCYTEKTAEKLIADFDRILRAKGYVLILNEYSHLPMTKTSLKSHTLMSMSSAIARELYQIIGDETKILEGIAEVFSQFFEDNYVSNTLRTISLLGQEMMFDRLTGFSEQVKVKWKLMMELFSVFHYEYVIQGLCEERYHLLIEHQNIQTLRNCNQHYDLAHAYEIYKRLYPHGCEMTTFEKAFIQLTGYTIEESGNVVTLTHMVDQFIHRFSLGEEKSIFEQGMKIDYVESQMISHANGYMWFANSGAWMDTYNIFQASDASLLFMLNEIQMVFEVHRTTEETTKFKSIINALRNGQKRIIDLMKRKLSLMQIPGIKI